MVKLSAFLRRSLMAFAVLLVCQAYILPVSAEVERIEVLERTLIAGGKSFGNVGPYEQLRGRLHFAAPAGSENGAVTDLRLAARDARGRVLFAADFVLMRPVDPERGNNRLLYEPADRGGMNMLALFNNASVRAPTAHPDPGNGFLMEQGYTLLWTGWSWDVVPGDGRLRADLPAAHAGEGIYGRISNEITVTEATETARQFRPPTVGYAPLRPDDPDARLMVRTSPLGSPAAVPRDRWRFGREVEGRLIYDPAYITLDGGFEPGALYTVTYFSRAPYVSGLGLVGIRDALLFFRTRRADEHNTPNPLLESGGALPSSVIALGTGQSAHALQTMIQFGLAAHPSAGFAFDGALVVGAGAGRGDINTRFAQPARDAAGGRDLDAPSFLFPFAAADQTDPLTNDSGGTLDQAGGAVPKLFYVNTSTAYWTRAASLTHTSAGGEADLVPHPNARLYMIAGGALRSTDVAERQELSICPSPLDDRPLLRALLIRLDGWATLNEPPPPNTVPANTDKTLGDLNAYLEAFPNIPGVREPPYLFAPPRTNFGERFAREGIADIVPPRYGRPYAALVPMPDEDGQDKGGIRLPDIAVPLGTYTGWNLQNAATGAPDRLARYDGGFVPFPRTDSERLAREDPRASIRQRYDSRDAYREAYAAAALALGGQGLLLGTDINAMVDRAGNFYDRIMSRGPAYESCGYLPPD